MSGTVSGVAGESEAAAVEPTTAAPAVFTPPPCPEDNAFCQGLTDQPVMAGGMGSCGSEDINLEPQGVNVMVAIDGSSSMAPFWPEVRSAIQQLRIQNPDSAFGLHLFYADPVASFEELSERSNLCGVTTNQILDVAEHSEQQLLEFLGDAPPGPNVFLPTSPLVDPLNYYLMNDTQLLDPNRTNYLVIISDGVDNCFGSTFTNPADKRLALTKVATELAKRNVRVIPIGFVAGQATEMPADEVARNRIAALDSIAVNGGAGLDKALAAEKPEDLAKAIAQVGAQTGNCRFAIPAALDPASSVSPFQLNFYVNGLEVPRDRARDEGWNFVENTTHEVEIFGQACEAVRAGAEVTTQRLCSMAVCGSAHISVETKPRVVLYMLDASASRLECQDDSTSCLRGVAQEIDRTNLTYWEVVKHALAQTLVAPINDDVEFGLALFPGSDLFTCEVGTQPEVLPAPANTIPIMTSMHQRLPFGRSPVAAALRSVADGPGRLADPSVSAAVVMLTDGGDNCHPALTEAAMAPLREQEAATAVAQQDIVDDLADSASRLLEADIKTYVVRFGKPSGDTPEQDAQLRAIVANGGTARSDPQDMSRKPYIDAKDAMALNEALAEVSDRLASCGFTIGGVPDDVDKNLANLYLNGALVPFDAAGTQVDGWGWADLAQTEVQLYGTACEDFKTNRKTSASLEFGCEAIPVIPPE